MSKPSHMVLPYQYWSRMRIENVPLTIEYQNIRQLAREDKKLWKQWSWGKKVRLPQYKLFPIFHTKIHFIRIDNKQLERWGMKGDNQKSNDKWWCDGIFDVYNKKANIRPLRRYKDFNSPQQMNTLSDLVVSENDKLGPYILGSSIQTDGLQIKVPVLSLRHTTPNLHKLFDRGYSGIPAKPKNLVDLSIQQKGIFKLSACAPLDPTSDRPVKSLDPGRKKVLAWVKSIIKDVMNDRETSVKENVNASDCFTNSDYHDRIGSTNQQKYEIKRREENCAYKTSIDKLQTVTQRTVDHDEMSAYIKKRLEVEPVREDELYNDKRRGLKFKVFRLQQKGLSYYAKQICDGNPDVIILMGNGTFSPGGSGYAAVPKKKFIREMAQFNVVVLVDEYNTSKCCPLCYEELHDVMHQSKEESERLRVCPTIVEGLPCLIADRDGIGAMNIMQKGLFALCSQPLSAFERVQT